MRDNFFHNMSQTLKELLIGISAWGVLLAILFLFGRQDIIFFVSLLVGILTAVCMAFHMNYFVETAIELDQKNAGKRMAKGAAIRTGAVILLLIATVMLDGNAVAVFFGLLTLKAGAYTQPITHKMLCRIYRKEEGR